MIFNIDYPTKVLIGEDASSQTGEKLKEYNISKVLCVYDPGIKSAGLVDKIIKNIVDQGIKMGNQYGQSHDDANYPVFFSNITRHFYLLLLMNCLPSL